MAQNLKFFYFTGNCHTSSKAKETITNNFLAVLDRFLRSKGGCSDPSNARVCEANKVDIKCGKIQSVNGRYRRNAAVRITYQFNNILISKSYTC